MATTNSIASQLLKWAKKRPAWQRGVLKRTASGREVSGGDCQAILDSIVDGTHYWEAELDEGDFTPSIAEGPAVSLTGMQDISGVNALRSEEPLTFPPEGLTVIYGDNGSGKSGYARILKSASGARTGSSLLPNVFSEAPAPQGATLSVLVNAKAVSLSWPGCDAAELRSLHFFDIDCARSYISTETDFPYRPPALRVVDGLIAVCSAVATLIDTKLLETAEAECSLPSVPPEITSTTLGTLIGSIPSGIDQESLDSALSGVDSSPARIQELEAAEHRLRTDNLSKERQRLSTLAARLTVIDAHLRELERYLGASATDRLAELRTHEKDARTAATLAASRFESEPLSSTGTTLWKSLWEAARAFSISEAYSGLDYPVTDDAVCVLCQQDLAPAAQERLTRFEEFVADDLQTKAKEAAAKWANAVSKVSDLDVLPARVNDALSDITEEFPRISANIGKSCDACRATHAGLLEAFSSPNQTFECFDFSFMHNLHLRNMIEDLGARAKSLSDPKEAANRHREAKCHLLEAKLAAQVNESKNDIDREIQRNLIRSRLKSARKAVETGAITRTVMRIAEEGISSTVRETFEGEIERLLLDRVEIAKTRGSSARIFHQPALLGAKQDAAVDEVLSEGEQTALGLAAFFTEVSLAPSPSTVVLDDPVTSLDHKRRSHVAERLAELAANRQVLVFTHDVAFVADLKREASRLGVGLAERSVVRTRGSDGAPGACRPTHPWRAQTASQMLGALEQRLARIRRDQATWDEETYETEVADWAGRLSEAWEQIISQDIVTPILPEGRLEVRPVMTKILVRFTDEDDREFQSSYRRISGWVRRHRKSEKLNSLPPEPDELGAELRRTREWFKRVRAYKN